MDSKALTEELNKKYLDLKNYLKSCGSLLVAYSSGVDSTFLLDTAAEVLGKDNVIAVTASSCFFPGREYDEAAAFCREHGIRQIVTEIDELEIEGIRQNPPDRCYICKKELFTAFVRIAEENGLAAVAEGSNMDDLGDYRPGLIAIRELGVRSPLRDAGLTKAEIRALSKQLGLPTWRKPSFACLASRFVYGEPITQEKLRMVGDAEEYLHGLGFEQLRVRIHGEDLARIEVLPEDIDEVMRRHDEISAKLTSLGFLYVTIDLTGYRTGSMNTPILRNGTAVSLEV